MGDDTALTYYMKVSLTALPRVLLRAIVFPLFRPKKCLSFCHQILNSDDLTLTDPVLGSRSTYELFPTEDRLIVEGRFQKDRGGGTNLLLELSTLASAVKFIRPKIIFEFGTFVGRTGRILLLNSPKDTLLYTLDLPPEQCMHSSGEDLRNSPESSRTVFLTGDSLTFDYSPWYGKCDLVWVDACHDYAYVASDTQNALRLVAPGGWIMWHDYRHTAWWSGVTKYVRELSGSHPAPVHVKGTTIAALRIQK